MLHTQSFVTRLCTLKACVAAGLICVLSFYISASASAADKHEQRLSGGEVFLSSSSDGRFEANSSTLPDGAHRVELFWVSGKRQGKKLSWAEAVQLWKSDPDFADYYSELLAKSPFSSFFWECPPITTAKVASGAEFEHVTVRNSHGFRKASPHLFQSYLKTCKGTESVVHFANLGGDSTLVAPCESASIKSSDAYGHIALFARNAPRAQQRTFWATVGQTLESVLAEHGEQPTWLSTEGSGVPWLHVRMDSTPKYYHHDDYAR